MKRTSIKRGGWLRRLNPLAKRSEKRKREDVEYRKFKAERMARKQLCEACFYGVPISDCTRYPTDLHHIVPLSAWPAGRMVASNMLCVCRPCHDWIHNNIKRATELGLLKRRQAS